MNEQATQPSYSIFFSSLGFLVAVSIPWGLLFGFLFSSPLPILGVPTVAAFVVLFAWPGRRQWKGLGYGILIGLAVDALMIGGCVASGALLDWVTGH
ncbi:MAG: hypothetical protein RL885_06165 [Planctomycetota bacterium]